MTERSGNNIGIPFIGILALRNRLITKSDLEAGLVLCKDSQNKEASLTEYFLSKGLISKKNIQRLNVAVKAVAIRKKEYRFGAIAVSKGFINKSVLELALEDQQQDLRQGRKPRLIGDMMVAAGLLSQKQRDTILRMQKRAVRPDSADDTQNNKPVDVPGQPSPAPAGGDPAETQGPTLMEPQLLPGGIQLQISSDYMAAFLKKTQDFDEDVLVSEIKEALVDRGVIFGVAVDEMIDGFIKSSGFKTQAFRVAKGEEAVQGKDAKIEFFFNTDYLKAGGMDENGNIDFRQRGEVPLVEKGTVLAEKTQRVQGSAGTNIFGDEITTTPGKDKSLNFGKGAVLSEDGTKLLADVRGYPKYTLGGVLFVHEEYTTGGDVNYETGHIEFDGNVNIKGCIKAGFRVRGNDISAIELDGGIIEAEGDLTIAGGINEGKIYARGNVYAKFIHASEIVCMGDICVQKEIVDSTVDCGGACTITRGTLISSKVTAKMGLMARNIGTQMASPSVIRVGYDGFAARELEENKAKASEMKAQIVKLEKKKADAQERSRAFQKEISEFAHIQDRAQLEQRNMQEEMNTLSDAAAKQALSADIARAQKKASDAEVHLDRCFNKSEATEALIGNIDKEIQKMQDACRLLAQERSNLIRWSKDNPGKAVVVVDGALLSGNTIHGKHSELTVEAMIRHARISEVLSKPDNKGSERAVYKMTVGNY